MKVLLVALVLVLGVFSIQSRPSRTPQQKEWNSLKNSDTWAKVILDFAELKNLSGGAIADLVSAIDDLMADLNAKNQRATAEFGERTNEHNSEVTRLNDEIDSANYDISSTTEFLDNVLYIQRTNLQETIVNLDKNIESTGKYIEEEKVLRAQQVTAYNTKMAEHKDAITAVTECLSLLSGLKNSGELSLVQKQNVKTQFERVQQKLGQNADLDLVEALVAMSTTEFADQSALANVENLLNEVKNNMIASQAKFTDEEEKAQAAHEEDVKNKTAEINKMIIERTDTSATLKSTEEKIANNEAFLAERKDDLEDFQNELAAENAAYQKATDLYNELTAQINSELSACQQALDLVNNGSFAGYIEGRMDQDVVIDQPHGDQLDVQTFDYAE